MKKTLLFSCACMCSFFSSEGECSNTLSNEILKKLYKTATPSPIRRVVEVDQPNSRVSIQDERRLNPETINRLKKNSFVPPKRVAVRADPDSDIIYFKTEE